MRENLSHLFANHCQKNGNKMIPLPYIGTPITLLPKMAIIIIGYKLLPKIAIKWLLCPFIANWSHIFGNILIPKVAKMAIFSDLKVAKNGK